MKSDLNRHTSSVHEKNEPLKCEVCDYKCYQKGSLNMHVSSVHEGNKPFQCEVCDYRCSQKGNLNMHVSSVHEGNKPFQCEICDYRYSRKSSLKHHVTSVHGGKKQSLWIPLLSKATYKETRRRQKLRKRQWEIQLTSIQHNQDKKQSKKQTNDGTRRARNRRWISKKIARQWRKWACEWDITF